MTGIGLDSWVAMTIRLYLPDLASESFIALIVVYDLAP